MTPYLLVETRSLWESQEVAGFLALARELGAGGNAVDVFLIQNGVLMVRDAAALALLTGLEGVTVWADALSLGARSIAAAGVPGGIALADMRTMIRLMTRAGSRTIWH